MGVRVEDWGSDVSLISDSQLDTHGIILYGKNIHYKKCWNETVSLRLKISDVEGHSLWPFFPLNTNIHPSHHLFCKILMGQISVLCVSRVVQYWCLGIYKLTQPPKAPVFDDLSVLQIGPLIKNNNTFQLPFMIYGQKSWVCFCCLERSPSWLDWWTFALH